MFKRDAKHLVRKWNSKAKDRLYVVMDDTTFEIGDTYTYYFDLEKQELIVRKALADEKGNKVSRRKVKGTFRPLVDIRAQSVLGNFKAFDQLKIEVFTDCVVVSGYTEETETITNALGKVFPFNVLRRRQTEAATCQMAASFESLSQAVGETFSPAFNQHIDERFGAENPLRQVLKVVSLCSGAGFSDLGLTQAVDDTFVFDVIKAYDYDPEPVETYRHNLGDHIELQDLLELPTEQVPSADVILATASCFGFSNSNRSGDQASKTLQNQLTLKCADIIRRNAQCKVFVVENVPQMLTAQNGRYFQYFLDLFSEFDITYGILNAADYGVPQARQRAFLIGSRIGPIALPTATHNEYTYVTVGEALSGLHNGLPNTVGRENCPGSSPRTLEKMAKVPWGGNWRDLLPEYEEDFLYKKDGTPRKSQPHSCMFHKFHPFKVARTIVNFAKTCMSNPFTSRILTIREACRLMGVPDTFEIMGKAGSRVQQVANGVCPAVMTAIGLQVIDAFKRLYESLHILPYSPLASSH